MTAYGPFSQLLSELFADAERILGIEGGHGIRWKDADTTLRASMPRHLAEHRHPYCMQVKNADPKRMRRCAAHCSYAACNWGTLKPPQQRSTCHAACIEVRMPVYAENKLLGTLVFGPFRGKLDQDHLPKESPFIAEVGRLLQHSIPRLLRERAIELADFQNQDLHPSLRLLSHALNDYQHQQTAAEIANICGVSVSRLQHLCKEQLGESLGKTCDRALLRRAQSLLTESPGTIAQIALQLGFEDQRYFATWFKRLSQHSPSQWRKQREEAL